MNPRDLLHGIWHVHALRRGARVCTTIFFIWSPPHPYPLAAGVAGWALAALPPMAALAAPVRIEGFGAASNDPSPVLRRNPASLPNVMEAATALNVRAVPIPTRTSPYLRARPKPLRVRTVLAWQAVNDSDSQRQLSEMMARLTARRAGLREVQVPRSPLAAPEGETAVTSAMGTPPVPIFRRSESSTSSSLSDSTDRAVHCTGQRDPQRDMMSRDMSRDTSQGSSSDSARGHDPAAPVRDRGGVEPRTLDTS